VLNTTVRGAVPEVGLAEPETESGLALPPRFAREAPKAIVGATTPRRAKNARTLKWRAITLESSDFLRFVHCPDCLSQTASDDPVKTFLKNTNGFP
jgi:hypothetical protein